MPAGPSATIEHSLAAGGVFLNDTYGSSSELAIPHPEVYLSRIDNIGATVQRGNVASHTSVAHMSNKTAYTLRTHRPDQLQSDIGIVINTAWWTLADKGYYEEVGRHLAEETGCVILVIGNEGSHTSRGEGVKDQFETARDINLLQTRHNVNQITRASMEANGLRENEVYNVGDSRGGMLALGNESAIYIDVTAPCNPKPCGLKDLAEVALVQVPREPAYLVHGMASVSRAQRREYVRTLLHNPKSIIHQVATGPTLFRDAGAVASNGNPKTPTYIRFHKDDLASRPKVWEEEVLAGWEMLAIDKVWGGHMTIMHPSNVINRVKRIKELQRQRGFDGDHTDVDWEAVVTAHERNRKIHRAASASVRHWNSQAAAA